MKPQNFDFNTYIYILLYLFGIKLLSIITVPQKVVDFWIIRILYCLQEDLEQPEGGTPALNVMAIRDQCHANVCKFDKEHYWLTSALLRPTARPISHSDW